MKLKTITAIIIKKIANNTMKSAVLAGLPFPVFLVFEAEVSGLAIDVWSVAMFQKVLAVEAIRAGASNSGSRISEESVGNSNDINSVQWSLRTWNIQD